MSHAPAMVEESGECPRSIRSARPLVWVACFDADDSGALARLLADAHFDVRVQCDGDLRDRVGAAPELAIFDGDRATDHDWIIALRAHRGGTRVLVRFDHAPAVWFLWYFTVLDGGLPMASIVKAVIRQSCLAEGSKALEASSWVA